MCVYTSLSSSALKARVVWLRDATSFDKALRFMVVRWVEVWAGLLRCEGAVSCSCRDVDVVILGGDLS